MAKQAGEFDVEVCIKFCGLSAGFSNVEMSVNSFNELAVEEPIRPKAIVGWRKGVWREEPFGFHDKFHRAEAVTLPAGGGAYIPEVFAKGHYTI